MKLTPGVDLINILLKAFACADPKNSKRYWQLDWILTLLGSLCIKAARKMLMKLTPCNRIFSRIVVHRFRIIIEERRRNYCTSLTNFVWRQIDEKLGRWIRLSVGVQSHIFPKKLLIIIKLFDKKNWKAPSYLQSVSRV